MEIDITFIQGRLPLVFQGVICVKVPWSKQFKVKTGSLKALPAIEVPTPEGTWSSFGAINSLNKG